MKNIDCADGFVGIFNFDRTHKVIGTRIPGNQVSMGALRLLRKKVETTGFVGRVQEFEIAPEGPHGQNPGYTYISFGIDLESVSRTIVRRLIAEFLRFLRQSGVLLNPILCPVVVPCTPRHH